MFSCHADAPRTRTRPHQPGHLVFAACSVDSSTMNPPAAPSDSSLLRHSLAALAYRTQKAVRGAGQAYGSFEAGHGVRSPHDLIRHMEGVIGYAAAFFDPVERPFSAQRRATFAEQLAAFHQRLEELGILLASAAPMHRGLTPSRLLQGPISDAMTHAGQLALLRRLADDSVPSENFIYADISSDNLGSVQPPPARPG